MRKLFILAVMAIISSAAFAQLGAPLTVAKGDARYTKITDLFTPTSFDTVLVTAKATAPTMPTGTSTTDVANTIFVDEMTYSHNRYLAWLKANGQSKLLGVPMFAANLLASQRSGVDGNMYLSSIQMNKDTVITTLSAQMITAGAYAGDNYNGMVIYRTSASGITLAGKTTNDASCWTGAAGTLVTKPLEAPVSVTKGEIIMVGFHYNNSAQTTAPVIATYGTSGTYLYALLTNSRKLTGVIATSTPGASYTWSSVFQNGDIVGILPK